MLTLWDPTDCSTPGFPIHHQLHELTQTHVHRVSNAIQPSHPLSSHILCRPLLLPPSAFQYSWLIVVLVSGVQQNNSGCVCVCVCILLVVGGWVCVCVCVWVCVYFIGGGGSKSCPTLCNPMDCSSLAPLSTGFPRQEYWSGCCHFLLQGIFPTQGQNPCLLHCRWIIYQWATRRALYMF